MSTSKRCPACGKEIITQGDTPVSFCNFCGAAMPPDITGVHHESFSNIMGLARTAQESDNLAEAEKYFTRALEIDPRNAEAWYGKGHASGWQSTLANIRVKESLVAFKNAIGTAPDENKQSTRDRCLDDLNHLVVTLYRLSREHLTEFVAVKGTWESYIFQILELILALEEVSEWDLQNKTILENIIHLCADLMEGITYTDPYDNNTSKALWLSDTYESLVKSKRDSAISKIKIIDPNYQAPSIVKKELKSCFVITATLGNPDHPTVVLLKQFREQWLKNKKYGSSIIKFYNKYGPIAAKIIASHKILQYISYVVIVLPAKQIALLALTTLNKQK